MSERAPFDGQIHPLKMEKDTRPNFKDIVPVDQPMTADEAIDLLANYHGVDRESIIQTFFALHRDSLEYISQVVFKETVSGGQECINIQVYNNDGEAGPGGQLVNPLTGNGMMRVG